MDLKGKKTQEISGRIDQIRQYFCNGVNVDFAAKIGKDPTYTSQLCTGTKSIGNKIIEKILETFPEVSKAWLYLGEGEMLRSDNSSQQSSVGDNSGIIVQHGDHSTYNNNTDLVSVVRAQQDTINRQNNTISTLTETNRQQSEQIGRLIEMLSTK